MKRKKRAIAFWICLFLLLILIINWNLYDKKRVRDEIKANSTYAIACVTKFSPYGGMGLSASTFVDIEFDIKEQKVSRRSSLTLPNRYKEYDECKGEKFMVVYDSLNTEICVLLFDYPVKDSADYLKYMEELEIKFPLFEDGGWFSKYYK